MPRGKVDYKKGLIYTIKSGDSMYVGSTTDFRRRKSKHKSVIYNENSKQYNQKIYKTIRGNNYEWVMRPYSQFPCNSKLELTIEEERVRQLLKADMNSYSCGTGCATKKEYQKQYRDEHKDEIEKYKKQYNDQHKDKISERQKEYNDQHKDEIEKYKKQWYEQHKDKLTEKNKQYYEQNKKKLSEKSRQKVTCACGCVVAKNALYGHRKTKKHIDLIAKLNH